MKEQTFQKKLIKLLEKQGFYVVKVISANRSGVPDIIACSPEGMFYAFEVKVGNNKPTALQIYNIDKINANNGHAFVINPENFKKILASIKKDTYI